MKKVRLVEVVNDFNKIRVPLSSNQRKLLKKIYPYYGAQGIVDYVEDFLFDGEYLLIAEDGENLKSNNQNICNMVKGKFWVNNHAHILQGKKDNLTRYLYYKLNTINFSPFVTGSSQPKLNKENLFSIEFFIHENIKTQRKIAKTLSDIDDKIEILHQINDNLAELAKTIYDYWFVQFDFPDENGKPYKTSGGKMVYNEVLKREIPEGWEVKRIEEVIEPLESGKRPKGGIDKTLKEGIPSLGAECIDELGIFDFSSTRYIPYSFQNKIKSGVIKNNDILIYKDGAYVGKTTIFKDNFPFDYATINEHIFLMRAKNVLFQNFLLFTLKQNNYFEIMQSLGQKAAQPGLNQEDLKSIKILVPNQKNINDFYTYSEKSLISIFKNANQSKELQSLRDWLLPMLMNGQISVE